MICTINTNIHERSNGKLYEFELETLMFKQAGAELGLMCGC